MSANRNAADSSSGFLISKFSRLRLPPEAGRRAQDHPKTKPAAPAPRNGQKSPAANPRLNSTRKISKRRYIVPEDMSMLPTNRAGESTARARLPEIPLGTGGG